MDLFSIYMETILKEPERLLRFITSRQIKHADLTMLSADRKKKKTYRPRDDLVDKSKMKMLLSLRRENRQSSDNHNTTYEP